MASFPTILHGFRANFFVNPPHSSNLGSNPGRRQGRKAKEGVLSRVCLHYKLGLSEKCIVFLYLQCHLSYIKLSSICMIASNFLFCSTGHFVPFQILYFLNDHIFIFLIRYSSTLFSSSVNSHYPWSFAYPLSF